MPLVRIFPPPPPPPPLGSLLAKRRFLFTMASSNLSIPAPADYHVHVRQGKMASLIAPHVKQGGFALGYVMPNTIPPISNTDEALAYKADLHTLAPETEWVMTLYLSPSLTPDEVRKAAKAGIRGVKSYPRGVTTNSDGGIENYELYYPVFEAMAEEGLVLNLHGEIPSDPDNGICVLNAELAFLKQLHKIHSQFPTLKIVLEHATTAAAVDAVKQCGPTVACSITAHHLALIVDDWAGKPLNFCKPVAKYPSDRAALQDVVRSGHPRFFLGSDSAPHLFTNKMPSASSHGSYAAAAQCACAAGVYTSAVLLPLCATLLESFGALDQLEGFVSGNGRAFYGHTLSADAPRVNLVRTSTAEATDGEVPEHYVLADHQSWPDTKEGKIAVVPFMAGKQLKWKIAP